MDCTMGREAGRNGGLWSHQRGASNMASGLMIFWQCLGCMIACFKLETVMHVATSNSNATIWNYYCLSACLKASYWPWYAYKIYSENFHQFLKNIWFNASNYPIQADWSKQERTDLPKQKNRFNFISVFHGTGGVKINRSLNPPSPHFQLFVLN